MSVRAEIKLPEELGISNVDKLVWEVWPALEACRHKSAFELVVDMSNLRFIWPTGLAALAAIIMYIARSRYLQRGHVIKPTHTDADQYLTRMGFYEFIDLPAEYPWSKRNSAGRFREVVEVTSEEMCLEVRRDLINILQSKMRLGQQTVHAVQYALSELLENVFHHAQSPVNAVVCAQTYRGLRQVELAIVDCGRGFRRSLLENPALRGRFEDAADAIYLAVQPAITSRPDHNAGQGLFFTMELVKQNRGDMVIYSEDGLFRIAKGQEKLYYKTPYWQGAIVSLCLDLNHPVDHIALFNQYAPPERDYEFLFDFDEEVISF